jgi:hypothetical protein
MINRYEVMWKDNYAEFETVYSQNAVFMFYRSARRLATKLNFIGFEAKGTRIAVIVDRTTGKQVSTGLYSDKEN